MIKDQDDLALNKSAKAILDRDIAQMDEGIVAGLRQIRSRAMAPTGASRVIYWRRIRLSLAGVVSGLLLAFVALAVFDSPNPIVTANIIEDMDIITSRENLDFYEDLEFYAWLAEDQDRGDKDEV